MTNIEVNDYIQRLPECAKEALFSQSDQWIRVTDEAFPCRHHRDLREAVLVELQIVVMPYRLGRP